MAKIPIIMDLIAGLFLACDLLGRLDPLVRFHNWIEKNLKKIDTDNLFNWRTVFFNIITCSSIFILILAWAWYSSSDQEASNIGPEILWFFIGAVAAWAIITPLAMLLKKIGQEGLAFPIGITFSIATLICVAQLAFPTEAVVSSIAFIYMCMLYPFAMTMASRIRKILLAPEGKKGKKDKQFYIFAMMGLVLFIASKSIEIVV